MATPTGRFNRPSDPARAANKRSLIGPDVKLLIRGSRKHGPLRNPYTGGYLRNDVTPVKRINSANVLASGSTRKSEQQVNTETVIPLGRKYRGGSFKRYFDRTFFVDTTVFVEAASENHRNSCTPYGVLRGV